MAITLEPSSMPISPFGSTESLDPKLEGSSKTKKTDSTQQAQGSSSDTTVEEVPKNTSSIPQSDSVELEPPSSQTTYSIGTAAAQFIELMNKANSSDGKGLFILYQLLRLLEEAINTQKLSAQNIRQQETLLAVSNIQREANTIESAAHTAFVFGMISGAFQLASSGLSLVGGIKGMASAKEGLSDANALKTNTAELNALETQTTDVKQQELPKENLEGQPDQLIQDSSSQPKGNDLSTDSKKPVKGGEGLKIEDEKSLVKGGEDSKSEIEGSLEGEKGGLDESGSEEKDIKLGEGKDLKEKDIKLDEKDVSEEESLHSDNEGDVNKSGSDKAAKDDKVDQAPPKKSKEQLIAENKMLETFIGARNGVINAQQTKYQGMAGIGNAIASFAKAYGDGVSGEQQAEAKKIAAETQQYEQLSQQTHDLATSIQELMQAVLKLMSSVREAEHETNINIMRGI